MILLRVFYDLLKKILRRESLDPPDSVSDMLHPIAASMVISSCFACGMLVGNTAERLVNNNFFISLAHFRLRKIVFRYLKFLLKLFCLCC